MKKTHVFLSSAFRNASHGADNYVKTLIDEDLTAERALCLAEITLQTREFLTVNSLIDNNNIVEMGPKWRFKRVNDKTQVRDAVLSVYRPATITECDDDMEYDRALPPWVIVQAVTF